MNRSNREHAESIDPDRKALGERLRAVREYLGFSQEEVAAHLGIPRSALSNIESGQRKVDALELKKLASVYKHPTSYFTGGAEADDLPLPEDVAHLARTASQLSPDDRAELGRFADFLRARKHAQEG